MIRRSLFPAFACFLALVSRLIAVDPPADPDGPYWEVDTTFNPVLEGNSNNRGGFIEVWPSPGGKLLVNTAYGVVSGVGRAGWLVRLNPDGQLDPDFHTATINASVLAVYSDGRVVYADSSAGGAVQVRRLLATGDDDPSFSPIAVNIAASNIKALVQNDGKILLYGGFSTVGGVAQPRLARLNADGSIDSNFHSPLPEVYNVSVHGATLTAGNQIVILGSLGLGSGKDRLARLNSDGSVDNGFSTTYSFPSNIYASPLTSETDGSIVLADGPGHLMRFTSAGAVDSSFAPAVAGAPNVFGAKGSDGKVYYTTLPSGSAIFELRRLNADYSADNSFAPVAANSASPEVQVNPPVITDGGSIFVGPLARERKSMGLELTRLTNSGAIDSSYQARFSYFAIPSAQLRQADGKILVAGYFTYVNGVAQPQLPSLVRLMADGTLDLTFNAPVPGESVINRLLPAPDGKVLACGGMILPGHGGSASAVRFDSTGALDGTFSPIYDGLISPAVDSEGRILAGWAGRIVRYLANGVADASFGNTAYYSGFLDTILPMADGNVLVATTSGSNWAINRLTSQGTWAGTLQSTLGFQFQGIVGLPDGSALVCLTDGATEKSIRVHRVAPSGNSVATAFAYRTKPFIGTFADPETQLAVAGFLNDQLRVTAGAAQARFKLDATGTKTLAMYLQGDTDQRVLITPPSGASSGRLRQYVKSTAAYPSHPAAPAFFFHGGHIQGLSEIREFLPYRPRTNGVAAVSISVAER